MTGKVEELKKYRIGVISGGLSSEREISLRSGTAVYKALTKGGFRAELIDVTANNYKTFINEYNFHLAFIALHGRFGEDGRVQAQMENKGIKYTGSGPEASMAALDKLRSKKMFISAGLYVPEYALVRSKDEVPSFRFSVPCVVKPRFEGSSVGLSVVKEDNQLAPAIIESLRYDNDVIVESFIAGKEVTVGVLGEKILPVVEIKTSGGVYDYTSKYMSADTEYCIPADLPEDVYRACQSAGMRAHKALGCRGFSRADIRISRSGVPYVLEVNTIPGLTERSLLPMAAISEGLDFFQLCVKMIEKSIKVQ